MANLNLSEFGEKLFVADADHTFIWDTANAISKRVSRNSWLNSGTLTSDAPVTISQTWDAGSNVMTAFKVVATDTASGSTSNLLELWAGSTPALDFAVTKAGAIQAYGTYSAAGINYARLALACDSSGNATIATQAAGSGVAGTVSINGVPVGLGKGNVVNNVAIGSSALSSLVGSSFNTAVGFSALANVTGGEGNTALGYQAFLNGNGGNNVVIGRAAANTLAAASNSVFIGTSCTGFTGVQNQIVIGASAGGIGQDSVVLGNDSITKTALKGNVGIGTTSPSSKLQVTGGDVEIETVTSGIIMKAAGTSTRYRITLNAGGTALVFTAI